LETIMTWTNERVERLKTLWTGGHSASAIAAKLGEVTRNAVIGKVHRLGLAGRSTGARKRAPRYASPRFPASSFRRRTRSLCRPRRTSQKRPAPKPSLPLPELGTAPDLPVTVLTLTATTCRWPIGDPRASGFHFCGRIKPEHGPYCSHHAAIACSPRR
jgi:GcrA cell cycle regulator